MQLRDHFHPRLIASRADILAMGSRAACLFAGSMENIYDYNA